MAGVAPTLSYCVVNTNGREDLLACLDGDRAHPPAGVEREILVLDNASEDGSAEAVRGAGRRHPPDRAAAAGRQGGERLDPDAGGEGRYCLLLNEDSELRPGAPAALLAALDADPRRRRRSAAARRRRHGRCPAPGASRASARRWPGRSSCTAASPCRAAARATRPVDWAQSSALLVRREAAAAVGYMDPRLLRLLRRVRLLQAPRRGRLAHPLRPRRRGGPPRPALDRPRGRAAADRRVPPQSRPLHAQAPLRLGGARGAHPHRLVLRDCGRWPRRFSPASPPPVYWAHARQALFPARGKGMRDRALSG